MQLDQLNGLLALKAVSETRNFTAAARTFDVSPSAISQTIKQLEKRLGVTLLARTTRSTSLTQAGEHDEVGVELDARESTDAERCQPVLVLQPAELTLDGGAAPGRGRASASSRAGSSGGGGWP